MKKLKLLFLLAFGLLFTLSAFAQKQEYALKIGGSFFIKCQRTIVYRGVDIMTLTDIENKGSRVNFDIYGSTGWLEASVSAGKLTGNGASYFAVISSQDEFTVTDRRDGRTVCIVKKKWNLQQERWDLLVWADLYLPDGGRFQCTPDTSNVPILNMTMGSTYTNMGTAIRLD